MNKRKRRGGRVTEPLKARTTTASSTDTAQLTMARPSDRGTGATATAIRPGLVSLRRSVPASIGRPPYAESGQPPANRGAVVQTPEIVERMRVAGRLAAEVLIEVGAAVAPGVTTDELDAIAHEAAIQRGSYPSPLNYRGYPKSLCTSVNEVICHGIPDSRALVDGDIVNLDVTVYHDGVHGDTNATFLVGEVDEASRRLVRERAPPCTPASPRCGPARTSTTSAGPSRTTPPRTGSEWCASSSVTGSASSSTAFCRSCTTSNRGPTPSSSRA